MVLDVYTWNEYFKIWGLNTTHQLQDRRPQNAHNAPYQSHVEGNSWLWRPVGLPVTAHFILFIGLAM